MPATIKHYNIAKARVDLSKIVDEIATTGTYVTIGKRETPEIFICRYSEDATPNSGYESLMANAIISKLFDNTPLHLKVSQLKEFEGLNRNQLVDLMDVDKLPIPEKLRTRLVKSIGERIISRLEKRLNIAKEIRKAQREGLYEAAEHHTTAIDHEKQKVEGKKEKKVPA